MHYDREEIAQASEAAADFIENLTDDDVEFRDASDLRAVASAKASVEAAEGVLRDIVAAARANGRSWALIATMLDVSSDAAQERFEGGSTPGS